AMKLLAPQALLLLLALPILVLAYKRRLERPPLGLPGIERRAPPSWQRHLPAALYGAALALAVLAAARPSALITLPSQQRTIVLVIDVSLSMRASDVQPSRIAAAQAAAREFLREPPGDVKIAIVSFAGTAAVVQQPTRDRDDLIAAIDRLQLDRHTAIGSGIIVALATLFPDQGIDVESAGPGARTRPAKEPKAEVKPVPPGSNPNAAIILLTDGRRTIGPDPLQAARMAADRGVRVYTVGFGNAQGGPVARLVQPHLLMDAIRIETGRDPEAAIIWLHGLGADGHDFEPIVPELGLERPVRFVFPNAPIRPVTINQGMRMRAWYDILQ